MNSDGTSRVSICAYMTRTHSIESTQNELIQFVLILKTKIFITFVYYALYFSEFDFFRIQKHLFNIFLKNAFSFENFQKINFKNNHTTEYFEN